MPKLDVPTRNEIVKAAITVIAVLLTHVWLLGGKFASFEADHRVLSEVVDRGSPTFRTYLAVAEKERESRREQEAATRREMESIKSDFNERIRNLTGLVEKTLAVSQESMAQQRESSRTIQELMLLFKDRPRKDGLGQ